MLSTELGFRVESVQVGFPDCEAKIRLPDGTYERVSIEFEYLSSHFPQHGHDSSQCDYIVCWLHDWKECPHDMNVIVLADEVKRLTSDTQVTGERQQP